LATAQANKEYGDRVRILSQGWEQPTALTIYQNNLWIAAGKEEGKASLIRISVTNGATKTMASNLNPAVALAADSTGIYLATAGNGPFDATLAKFEPKTFKSKVLAHNLARPNAIRLYGSKAIWTSMTGSEIMAISKEGGVVECINIPGGKELSIDTTGIYFLDAFSVMYAPFQGKSSWVNLSYDPNHHLQGMALDNKYVYFSDSLYGTIMRVPKKGGKTEIIIEEPERAVALEKDGEELFWLTTAGALRSKKLDGQQGKVKTWAQGSGEPIGLAVNSRNIFWAVKNELGKGAILSVSRR
jgi:hypothetical protein